MRATALLALATVVACGGVWLASGQDPAPTTAPVPQSATAALGPFPRHALADDLDCATCHTAIVDEWAASAHAHAWNDELYQAELKTKQRPESCHGCHIPTPLFEVATNQKPPPRNAELEAHELGISCATCHAGPDRTILGPYGAQTNAHTSKLDPRFTPERSNELCIGCHATTIGPVIGIARDFLMPPPTAPSNASAGAPRTCVGCHMSEVERSMATDANDEPLPARKGRSHRILGPYDPAFLATAFGFETRVDAERTTVSVSNRAGHRIPGLLERRFDFAFDALDAAGNTLASGALAVDNRAFLAADATKEVELPAATARIRVRGTHRSTRLGSASVVFIDADVPIER